jgi:hypothetical protein
MFSALRAALSPDGTAVFHKQIRYSLQYQILCDYSIAAAKHIKEGTLPDAFCISYRQ